MSFILFEWFSTIFFLIGSFFFTGKKASKPRVRVYSFYFYMIGGIIFIVLNLIYQSYAFATTQIIFTIMDVRGIRNCRKEIKKGNPFIIDCELPEDYYSNEEYNE